MHRRTVLRLAALSAGAIALQRRLGAASPQQKILDTHIHLFDPTRPGGVIWPEKTDTALYKPALPDRYKAMAAPFGVVGAIAIEASPLNSDNQWLLDVVRKNPVMVGAIGNLIPGSTTYTADLDRLHADPLFLGFRYGNLWDRDLATDLAKPGFVDGLKALAQAGLVLDSANPDPKLIRALLEVSDRAPNLRIVIDHLPHSPIPTDPSARTEYDLNLSRLAKYSNVFVKLSEIPVVENGKLLTGLDHYKAALDAIWNLFGENRILFGSDWPNSDHVAPFADTLSIVRSYISTKSAVAQEKYFFSNSIAAYRWRPRTPDQHAHSTATGS